VVTTKQRRSLVQATNPREMAKTPAELEAAILARREEKTVPAPAPRAKATFDIPKALLRERVALLEPPPNHGPGGLSVLVARGIEADLDRLRRARIGGQPFENESSGPRAPKGPARRG
jgi:hypothetical protein